MTIPNLSQDPTGQTFLLQSALASLGFDIKADNWRGPKTERALTQFAASLQSEEKDWQTVKASSFADPKDVAAFKACKKTGKTDMQCFAVGDNGIGAWGEDTTTNIPMVALPREIWRNAGKTGGDIVIIRRGDKECVALLGDTMPSLANIKNGAGIDLNPAAAKALGLTPPFLIGGVQWRWA